LADREARRSKTSRSQFIRSAVRSIATENDQTAEKSAAHERRRKAIEGMRRLAQKFGDWPAEDVLYDMRHRL
jgi:Arc/MetJ-type ribon-helix-helix transcriptional regulator